MRAMNGYRQIAQPLLERFRNLHENPETERSQRFSDWSTFPDLTIRDSAAKLLLDSCTSWSASTDG
jgi:hypothetical protein